MADRQARGGPRPGKPDEVLSGNIGNEQRGADGEPSHVATCQKIIGGISLSPREIEANGKHHHEVDRDDGDINGLEPFVGKVNGSRDHAQAPGRRFALPRPPEMKIEIYTSKRQPPSDHGPY